MARIERICRRGMGERELRVAVLRELRSVVGFDAYAWLLTDPASCVGWSPVADVPAIAELPEVIHAKYLTTVNRWTDLTAGTAATLVGSTGGDLARSRLWRDVQSRYAVTDVASVVLRDRAGCWGFIDLWRRGGVFEPDECETLGVVAAIVTPALRKELMSTFTATRSAPIEGPAVLLLGDDLSPMAQTNSTGHYLHALLPADPGRAAVPAAALNVAAQLCAVEEAVDHRRPAARTYVPGRSWMTIRAGRIGPRGAGATIAVTIEPTPPDARSNLYASVAGLTDREGAVLAAIVTGHDTRHAAHLLGITEHTVQDHLKAIFSKTGTDSRRQLIARATGPS